MQTKQFFPLFTTQDLEPTRAFYVDHLGFQVTAQMDCYLELRHPGGATLCFMKPMPDVPVSSPTGLYYCFEVEDVDAEHARLEAAGLKVQDPPEDQHWGDRRMVLRDPSGISLYVYTRVAAPAGAPSTN